MENVSNKFVVQLKNKFCPQIKLPKGSTFKHDIFKSL